VLALIVVVGKVTILRGTISWMNARFVTISHESQIEFSWRAEPVVSLLWALDVLAERPEMDQGFSVFETKMIGEAIKDPENFLSTVTLRHQKSVRSLS
jgi:hypothetical protein